LDNEFLKDILLENLSFYEWMNMENILISIDPKDLTLIHEVGMDQLENCLEELVKNKEVELKVENKEARYKRVMKKRGLLSRLMK
jgi:hypothetical protein